jgi:hypothetical protein
MDIQNLCRELRRKNLSTSKLLRQISKMKLSSNTARVEVSRELENARRLMTHAEEGLKEALAVKDPQPIHHNPDFEFTIPGWEPNG